MNSVWVIDDHSVIRQGLKRILTEDSDEFEVTAEAGSVQELFSLLAKRTHPQALILDLSMPGRGGLDALVGLKERELRIPVLILSIHPEDQYAIRALKAGASGYLSKECAPEQLITALKTIIRGEKYITSQVATILAENLQGAEQTDEPHKILSDREYEILILIAKGKSLTEIAENFYLSVKTVSTYRTRILKKMCLKTNADLVQYVVRNQLLPD